MRVVTFKNKATGSRIGLVHGEKIADLRATFETLLCEEKGVPAQKARDDASQQVPDSMLDLISREDEGVACIRQANEFLIKSDEKGKSPEHSPGGDRIFYAKDEV